MEKARVRSELAFTLLEASSYSHNTTDMNHLGNMNDVRQLRLISAKQSSTLRYP